MDYAKDEKPFCIHIIQQGKRKLAQTPFSQPLCIDQRSGAWCKRQKVARALGFGQQRIRQIEIDQIEAVGIVHQVFCRCL